MKKLLIFIFLTLIADTNIEQIYPRFVIEDGQFIYHNHSDAEIIYINIEIQ